MNKYNPLQPPTDGVKPQEVRFTEFRAEPWHEGNKIRVHAQITPFVKPPDLEVIISDLNGNELSTVNIIENIDFQLVFTMHIRNPSDIQKYNLVGKIIYEDLGVVNQTSTFFEIM
jgi:hypothetical protein